LHLFNIENLVLGARSEYSGFASTGASFFGVLEHIDCGFGNADCGILKEFSNFVFVFSIRNPKSPIRNVMTPADCRKRERACKPP
jgi:hypothetical protein